MLTPKILTEQESDIIEWVCDIRIQSCLRQSYDHTLCDKQKIIDNFKNRGILITKSDIDLILSSFIKTFDELKSNNYKILLLDETSESLFKHDLLNLKVKDSHKPHRSSLFKKLYFKEKIQKYINLN